MKCRNCGEENVEDAKYCFKCGTLLETDFEDAKGEKKALKNKSKMFFLGASCIVLFAGILFVSQNKKDELSANDKENVESIQEEEKEESVLPFLTNQSGEFSEGTTPEDYILAESDCKIYTADELGELTAEELRIARNEIFARHGRMFTSEDMNTYFSGKKWYTPVYSAEEFDALGDSVFNEFEIVNRNQIVEIEKSGEFNHSENRVKINNIEDDDISGEYYLYQTYSNGGITSEMIPQDTTRWITVTKNDDGILLRAKSESSFGDLEQQYKKESDNRYVCSAYWVSGDQTYDITMEFYGDGTVKWQGFDDNESEIYKKQ